MKEKSTLKDVANNYLTHPLKNKGITLITLVITIIIIIILATITLNLAVGDGGLIKQAETTKNLTESTTNKVSGLMSNLTAYLEEEFKEPETPPEPEEPEEPSEPEYPTIEEVLHEGDYVYYQDGTRVTRECVVLYGPENLNYSSYGIQIIPMETVEDVTLGYGDTTVTGSDNFTRAMNSYNNAIKTLNDATSKYLNTTYATSVRCVGSVPNDPYYDEAGMYNEFTGNLSSYNGQFKDSDDYLATDYSQMRVLNIWNIGKIYWLPSRYTNNIANTRILLRMKYAYGSSYEDNELCTISETNRTGASSTMPLRPVFTLKPGLKVTGGSGTSDAPYTLGV